MNDIPFDKIEKDSGLISTGDFGLSDFSVLNCGEATGNQGFYTAKFESVTGRVSVVVREIKSDETQVIVNVFGRAYIAVKNIVGATLRDNIVECASTGRLEAHLFSDINTLG